MWIRCCMNRSTRRRAIGATAPSCLRTYGRREKTRLEHQWEITRREGWRDFTAAEADLRSWLADLAWTTGDGPRALFAGAMAWLRQRQVLLPGVSRLARLVASQQRLCMRHL